MLAMELVQIFLDTKNKYLTKYADETKNLIKDNTYVYIDPINDLQIMPHPKMPNQAEMEIRVTNGGTVETGHLFANKSKTAILNFADALTPGGLIEIGAATQEENICRCSNLYASITSETAKRYYQDNNNLSWENMGIYTDDVIYSKDVLFFKDDVTYGDVKPYHMDVITCPAPSTSLPKELEETVIYNRIEKIIKVAALNKVETLILGAWGCGAFGQDADVVSKAFAKAVKKYPAFDRVIYAIRPTPSLVATETDSAYDYFVRNCQEV